VGPDGPAGLEGPGLGVAHDLGDQRTLRRRVVVHVSPLLMRQRPLEILVACRVVGGGAEPVPEQEMPAFLIAAGDPEVDVHVTLGGAEQAMVAFDHARLVPGCLEPRVQALIVDIVDRNQHVDNRLRRKTRHRRRPDVLDPSCRRPERRGDPFAFDAIAVGPPGVGIHDDDRSSFATADQDDVAVLYVIDRTFLPCGPAPQRDGR